jgi:hypothetical protein
MLEDPKFGVEGPTLPKGETLMYQTFVDDIALHLKGME